MSGLTWTCGMCNVPYPSEDEFMRHRGSCGNKPPGLSGGITPSLKDRPVPMLCHTCGMVSSGGSTHHLWCSEMTHLRARVKELEKIAGALTIDEIDEFARTNEDLRRKRGECARLESQIGDMRRQNLRIAAERDDARAALASSATELAKLRRELRGKR